ncbi:MAG: N-acetylmuramoyl-L-alanine amidase CwlD [bacterium]|nr:N-acetylmuramoyl-L-alanine amidase CwlD [bacterium]
MKKIYYLFIFIIITCSITFVNAKNNTSNLSLIGKVIYIDAGHGGLDPGSTYGKIYEKDINLSICKKLQKVLEEEGAIVYMTRYDDYDLSINNTNGRKKRDLNNRVKIINDSNADMYISIHLNSISSSKWSGAQVFYDDVNNNNYSLALIIQNRLKKDLKTNRKVKEIKNMLMNRKITIPGVLVEAGFLSNSNDRYLLKQSDYQYKIASSIRDGIIEYFNGN